jgi:hypothetical protein
MKLTNVQFSRSQNSPWKVSLLSLDCVTLNDLKRRRNLSIWPTSFYSYQWYPINVARLQKCCNQTATTGAICQSDLEYRKLRSATICTQLHIHHKSKTVTNIRFLQVWQKTLKKCFENYMINTQPWADQYIQDEVRKWFWGIQNMVNLSMEPPFLCVFHEDPLPEAYAVFKS